MEIKFIIPGNPLGRSKYRPSVNNRIWDEYKRESFTICNFIEEQMTGKNLLIGPLFLDFRFFMMRPRGIGAKPGQAYPVNKPNIDNIIHMYLHCFDGLVFKGSQHVASIKASKLYDTLPRTEVIVIKM